MRRDSPYATIDRIKQAIVILEVHRFLSLRQSVFDKVFARVDLPTYTTFLDMLRISSRIPS